MFLRIFGQKKKMLGAKAISKMGGVKKRKVLE